MFFLETFDTALMFDAFLNSGSYSFNSTIA